MMVYKFISILFLLFLISCNEKGIGDISRFNDKGDVHLVVEIPAGTLKKYEYDYDLKGFKNKVENKKERSLDFLTYPFNFGFIPPFVNENKTETIIISETFSTGTLLEGKIIGAIEYTINSEKKIVYIGIPIDYKYNNINTKDISINNKTNLDLINIINLFLKYNNQYIYTGTVYSAEESFQKLKNNK